MLGDEFDPFDVRKQSYALGYMTDQEFREMTAFGSEFGDGLVKKECLYCGIGCMVYPDEAPMCKEHWRRYPKNWQVELSE